MFQVRASWAGVGLPARLRVSYLIALDDNYTLVYSRLAMAIQPVNMTWSQLSGR